MRQSCPDPYPPRSYIGGSCATTPNSERPCPDTLELHRIEQAKMPFQFPESSQKLYPYSLHRCLLCTCNHRNHLTPDTSPNSSAGKNHFATPCVPPSL